MVVVVESKKLLAGVIAAGAVLGSAGSASAAAAAGGCESPGFNPYSADAATLAACGMTVIPETSSESLPGGGTEYDYQYGSIEQAVRIPPPGFDAATASASELAEYGIPAAPNPLNTSAYAQWSDMAENMRFVTPPNHLVAVPLSASTNETTLNWSGYAADSPPGGGGYVDVHTEFTMPNDLGTAGCTPTSSQPNGGLFWVGLGGLGISKLIQNGVSIGLDGLAEDEGWTEALPQEQSVVAQPFYATPGANVSLETNYTDGNDVDFYFYNYSTNIAYDVMKTGLSSDYNGATAEVIAERPYDDASKQYYKLEQYSPMTTSFVNVSASNGSYGTFSSFSNDRIWMQNPSTGNPANGDLLATPSSLSAGGNDFTDTWNSCLG
jgi:hypothetical protein